MSERREVRGWASGGTRCSTHSGADSWDHRTEVLVRVEGHPTIPSGPVVIRHADDDAALLEELERLRKLTDHESDQ